MKTIGHITNKFLDLSQTFVHRQIVQNQWFRNVVFTRERMNEHLFPALDLVEIHNKADLAKAIEQSRVDLIHAHFGPNALYALSAKKKLGIPMLTFIHGYDAWQYPNRTAKKMKRYIELFEAGELFAVPSEAIKQQLIALGCPTEKVIVCHLGVDLSFRFRPRTLDNGEIRLISVGRLVEKKGHNHLIQALSIVQKQIPNFHLTIIGKGAEREELTALIARLGLEEKVSLLGGQSHSKVLDELDRSHIFCLASVTGQDGDMEGLPVSILEAQAMGLPVVSTRHSGIPEGVDEGRSALLAEEGNPSDLAQKIIEMMSEPERWPQFGLAGREWVGKYFDGDKQAEELKNIYDRLLAKR